MGFEKFRRLLCTGVVTYDCTNERYGSITTSNIGIGLDISEPQKVCGEVFGNIIYLNN